MTVGCRHLLGVRSMALAPSPSMRRARQVASAGSRVPANGILVDDGVLDGYGHVSVRHPGEPAISG